MTMHQCPCCDYFTLPERETYFICPICNWEDDGLGLNSLDACSGPNHTTLREARKKFMKYGSVSEKKRKLYEYKQRVTPPRMPVPPLPEPAVPIQPPPPQASRRRSSKSRKR